MCVCAQNGGRSGLVARGDGNGAIANKGEDGVQGDEDEGEDEDMSEELGSEDMSDDNAEATAFLNGLVEEDDSYPHPAQQIGGLRMDAAGAAGTQEADSEDEPAAKRSRRINGREQQPAASGGINAATAPAADVRRGRNGFAPNGAAEPQRIPEGRTAQPSGGADVARLLARAAAVAAAATGGGTTRRQPASAAAAQRSAPAASGRGQDSSNATAPGSREQSAERSDAAGTPHSASGSVALRLGARLGNKQPDADKPPREADGKAASLQRARSNGLPSNLLRCAGAHSQTNGKGLHVEGADQEEAEPPRLKPAGPQSKAAPKKAGRGLFGAAMAGLDRRPTS